MATQCCCDVLLYGGTKADEIRILLFVVKNQYLILHVITASVLSQVQQLCMSSENMLHTYFSSFVNTGKTPKLLFFIKRRQDKGFIGLHSSVNALTIQKITGNHLHNQTFFTN